MSIEQYYSHIVSYPYVDVDFYKIEDVDRDMLKLLGFPKKWGLVLTEQMASIIPEILAGSLNGQPIRASDGN